MTERASGHPEAGGPSATAPDFGASEDDPLVARLLPPLPGSVQWGLERTARLLTGLGNPHLTYPVLHVGGTNGKGSVARVWAGILQAAGLRTGLYTSPHLISFRERILVDGRPLHDELLNEWARELRPLLVRESPSFFEATTVLAFLALARSRVDVAVVEVGLGGRLDSTNVVSPLVTAITNVSPEHRSLLGDTARTIALEKAGILKPGVPAFTAAADPQVLSVLAREAAARGVPLKRVVPPSGAMTLDGSRFRLETRRWGGLELASPLVGRHQILNVALAVRSLEALPPRVPITASAVREGVLRTRVAGRFQVEREGERTWILDVAHNPGGVAALTSALDELDVAHPRVGVVGILADKDWGEMLRDLARTLDVLILTVPPSAAATRRWDPEAGVAALARDGVVRVAGEDAEPPVRAGAEAPVREGAPDGAAPGPPRAFALQSFDRALEEARGHAGPRGTVVVTGSVHTVGDALRELDRVPREALPPPFDFG